MADDVAAGSIGLTEASDARLRLHAACDECRKRKLKCSGELSGCSRCIKQEIPCVYSQQKQMGRPRKKQRTEEASMDDQPVEETELSYLYSEPLSARTQSQWEPESQSTAPIDPSLANVNDEMTSFQNVCTGPIAQTIRNQRNAETLANQQVSTNMFEQADAGVDLSVQHAQYPTDISQWPDFSTIDTLPFPMVDKYGAVPPVNQSYATPSATSMSGPDFSASEYDVHADPTALSSLPAIPACPCLPNLYLTLSTLSTLPNFPVSQSTIDTLLSAHKTAHSVIYCHICPQQYQSGSQNLMLGCTLLNIVADHWHRVRRTGVEQLKKGFGTLRRTSSGQTNGTVNHSSNPAGFISAREGNQWRHFAKLMIRAYVFGDTPIPNPLNSTSPSPTPPSTSADTNDNTTTSNDGARVPEHQTLKFLISALRRRQRQWHGLEEATDEFPDRQAPSHNQHGGRPSIVEAAGKLRDFTTTTRTHEQGNRNGQENGTHSHDHAHDHDHGHGGREAKESDMLCLMIVKHSMDIVEALDEGMD